jgi:nucleotide-binding universal stress UspA family protein
MFELDGTGRAFDDNIRVLTKAPVQVSGGPLVRDDELIITGTVHPFALQRIAERHCPGVAVELSTRSGVPMHVILEEAEQRAVDLILIPTSGRSRVARFFLGSTADRIIREASCPVLVIPTHTSG